MTKVELISALAIKNDSSKKDAETAINGLIDVITETLASGGDINIVGFGKLSVVDRPAREGRNPKDGSKIKIPASKNVKFKAGKILKDSIQ